MKHLLLSILLTMGLVPLSAQPLPNLGETALNWPGIQCQIYSIQRIPEGRLLLVIRLKATAEAASGTLIGSPAVIPPGTKESDLVYYQPVPYSLASSVMVDDISQKKYPALPAGTPPPGVSYFPDSHRGYLSPGQNLILSVQFACPPPPPVKPGEAPIKQTLSFLFTNAKGTIKGVPLPTAP